MAAIAFRGLEEKPTPFDLNSSQQHRRVEVFQDFASF